MYSTLLLFQVRFLQEQARKVLEDARLSSLLHATSCNFKKIPGTIYYVYKQRKNPDQEFISMISPQVRNSTNVEKSKNMHCGLKKKMEIFYKTHTVHCTAYLGIL